MLRGFLLALAALVIVGIPLQMLRWHDVYSEAETRSSIAQEFGRRLSERIARDERHDAELADIEALLADDYFARLRDRAFVPSFAPGTLITLRINDTYEFPIARDRTVGWTKRQ